MQSMWKHRRAVLETGASGRFGRAGLGHLAVFQVLLPLLAPLVDIFLIYGLLFLDPVTTLIAWSSVQAIQLVAAVIAFRLEREPLRVLWLLPLQQIVYRQLMYAVLIRSMVTAAGGIRLGWQKLRRVGGLEDLLPASAGAGDDGDPARAARGAQPAVRAATQGDRHRLRGLGGCADDGVAHGNRAELHADGHVHGAVTRGHDPAHDGAGRVVAVLRCREGGGDDRVRGGGGP